MDRDIFLWCSSCLLLWSLCWVSPCKLCSAVNTPKFSVFGAVWAWCAHCLPTWGGRRHCLPEQNQLQSTSTADVSPSEFVAAPSVPTAGASQVHFANSLEWRRKRWDGRTPAPQGRGTWVPTWPTGRCVEDKSSQRGVLGAAAPAQQLLLNCCHPGKHSADERWSPKSCCDSPHAVIF